MNRRSAAHGLFSALILVCVACVQSHAAHAQAAHVHGVSRVEIAVEGNVLHLGVHVAGLDAVGFEHAAATDAQRAAVIDAAARLRSTAAWLAFEPADGCAVSTVSVEATGFDVAVDARAGGGSGHSGHAAHGGEAGDAEHAGLAEHAEHAEHGDESDHGDHAGFAAMIEARCPGEPSALHVRLGSVFPAIQQIEADLITAAGQGRVTLQGGETRIPLR